MPRSRANGEGSIRQHRGGLWEVRITIGIDFATGEPKRISRYTQTQEEAVKLLHQLSFLKDTSPKNFESITFGEWLDLCLEVYTKPSLKQSTYLSYESYIRVHFKPAFGELLLRDITPRLLQNFYNYKTEQEGLAPKTVINMNLFLHKSLSHAVNEGYIKSNPAEAINLSRGHKPQIVILTRDEQAMLMRGSYLHRYGVFVRLTLFTGIRVGELLGLRYLIDCNATQAAIRAGYSPKTAKQMGQRLLTFVDLKTYIDEQLERIHNEKTAYSQGQRMLKSKPI